MTVLPPQSFAWYEYVVFGLTLAISLAIGLWFAWRGQNTTAQYLMANRTNKVLPIALSMFMSYMSAILVLGTPVEVYLHGIQVFLISIGASLAAITCSVHFVPLFFRLRVTSAFEYLELRYSSRAVRQSAVVMLLVSQLGYVGIATFSPATALHAVTGIPVWVSIVAIGVIGTIYTSAGGISAVIWTDVFQFLVFLLGTACVLVVGTIRVGGVAAVWSICSSSGRLNLFDFRLDPTIRMTFWGIIVGRLFGTSQLIGTGQSSVQRYCSLPSLKKAKFAVLLTAPCTIIIYGITCGCGLVLFAFYHNSGCDPIRSGQLSNQNQLLPFFVVHELNVPLLPGLFVAVLFSGALSSISSSLNSMTAVVWKDILENLFEKFTDRQKTTVTKMVVFIFGTIGSLLAYATSFLGGHVLKATISFVGGTAGPLLGLFCLASVFPWSNWIGATVGVWAGLAVVLVPILGSFVLKPHRAFLQTSIANCSFVGFNPNATMPMPEDPSDIFTIFRFSFLYHSMIGAVATVFIGLVFSLLTGPDDPSKQDPRLIAPFFDQFFCCLPASLRSRLRCRVPHQSVRFDERGLPISWLHDGKLRHRSRSHSVSMPDGEDAPSVQPMLHELQELQELQETRKLGSSERCTL